MGNRSLLYSLWQLIWRPGYFISDYINGKRQVSFPPVKMLVVMGWQVFSWINCYWPRLQLQAHSSRHLHQLWQEIHHQVNRPSKRHFFEREFKAQASTFFYFSYNGATMQHDSILDDGEPQSRSTQ